MTSIPFLDFLSQAWPLFVVVVFVVLVRRSQRRVPDWGVVPNAPLERETDGAWVVPVAQIDHRRTLRHTSNGLSPRLWITNDGLRFKVFRPNQKRFDEFKRVDARPALFGRTRLSFVGHGETVSILLRERAVARAVLCRLPPQLPLTPSAAALRGS